MALTDSLEALAIAGINTDGLDPLGILILDGRIMNDSVVCAHKRDYMKGKIERGGPGKGVFSIGEFNQILRDMPDNEKAALRARLMALPA
jgi:hypothetical protein